LNQVSEQDRQAFQKHAGEIMVRISAGLAVFFLLATLAWWPLDFFVFADTPELRSAFGRMRIGVAIANAVLLAFHLVRGFPRPFIGINFTIVVCIQIFWATRVVGEVGGLGSSVVTFFYLAPFLSLALLWSPWRRSAAAGGIACSVWLGFYAADPAALTINPGWKAQTTFLVFCAALAAGIGHIWYQVVFSDFVARNRLAQRDRQLQEMADSLQQRVDEQTIELRRLAAHIDDTREAERRWIAAELHDELGQQLAAMRLATDYGRGVTAPGPSRDVLIEIGSLLDRTHDTIRRILRAMQPKVLDELGLPAALCWLGDEMTERSELVCSVNTPLQTMSLPPHIAAALFRCAQEACTNAVRHAQASQIHIDLAPENAMWVLTIRDDGRGIAPQLSTGLGMAGIRERAIRWGGRAEWSTNDGGGTVVRIELPDTPVITEPEMRP
jgi:signal transduction histidine kinase